MHGSHITACLLALAAFVGCGDDAPKASISDDTNWQIGCVGGGGGGCSGSLAAHRDREDEDLKIKVSCRRQENGLTITLDDPGIEPKSSSQTARPYGKLTITRLDPENNRCSVAIVEQERATGGELELRGACGDTNDSACTVEGELDSNGWAFDGTLTCSGLNFKNVTVGLGPYTLQAAAMPGEPMVLQVANCD